MQLLADQTDQVLLSRLLDEVTGATLTRVGSDDDPDLADVVQHSDRVGPGALFCCVRGSSVDGHDHARQALDDGAVALLVDHQLDLDAPQLVAADVRRALGPVAATFWGHPSRSLLLVGVTGTNGKTTVTHLVADVFEHAGRSAATIGTLSGARASGVPTTPEASELQAELARAVDDGRDLIALEVSSHALAAGRVDGSRFAAGVFTNLSPDHLDHHGTLEAYFDAKARLFERGRCERAVINADDEHGRVLLDRLGRRTDLEVHAFSLADAADVELGRSRTRFRWRGRPVELSLPGAFNVSNALAAATCASALGLDDAAVAAGLGAARAVPGRLEPVEAGQDFDVFVDFAHTPDSLRAALEACRQVTDGRVLVVFGCGGDRDRAKRPAMGAIAERLADRVHVTSDNPRSEDPERIIAEIVGGMTDAARAVVEPDRAVAIRSAVGDARPGDVVLIAGKGHETTQVVGDATIDFDDRVVAAEALADRCGGRS